MDFFVILLVIMIVFTFTVIVWNSFLPISSQANSEFLLYLKHKVLAIYPSDNFIEQHFYEPAFAPIMKNIQSIIINKNPEPDLGPRTIAISPRHYVTLTFYIEIGNHRNLPELIDLLDEYKIKDAVFVVQEDYAKEHPFMIRILEDKGYLVKPWSNFPSFEPPYIPSNFMNFTVSDKSILSSSNKDLHAQALIEVVLRYQNHTMIAFTPKVMSHQSLLESVLKFNEFGILFIDRPSDTLESEKSNIVDLSSEKQNEINLYEGRWTLESLANTYPFSVTIKSNNTFVINEPIIFKGNSSLEVRNERVFLASDPESHGEPVFIEIQGNSSIYNSLIQSIDTDKNTPDPNPYHPRPFLLVKGGKLDIINSTISHLGYSLGGIQDTRFARAAVGYYDSQNFIITNSTISNNYYGFYSSNSSNFVISYNDIFGQTRYGLDPHSGSKDFTVSNNHIHDNGLQGFICSHQCDNVTIIDNVVEHNYEGIGLHWLTNSSTIKGNTVTNNEKFGIFIQNQSFGNLITDNTVVENGVGIGLEEQSLENVIINNFIDGNLYSQFEIDSDSADNKITNNTLDMHLSFATNLIGDRSTYRYDHK